MKRVAAAILLLIPGPANAASDCRIVEYPDHFVAICTGQQPGPGGGRAGEPAAKPDASAGAVPVVSDLQQLHNGRQGRPYGSDLEMARAERTRLILERQGMDRQSR